MALGADSPEISSAIVALLSNQRDLGVGIVLGSNLFNLAALLGLGAVIAGEVSASSAGTILDGAVAIAITLIAGALLGGIAGPLTSSILVLLICPIRVYPGCRVQSVGSPPAAHFVETVPGPRHS